MSFVLQIDSLDDPKSIPSLQRKIQEYEAIQARIGQPATLQGFLFEYMDKERELK